MTSTLQRARHVLVIEDNDADVELLREALHDVAPSTELETCVDGNRAMRHLDAIRAGEATVPDLVLLDLNLPGASGIEVLTELKRDPALMTLPVVILTTSHAASDVERCYGLHANAYVVKASNFADFVRDVDVITQFWFETSEAPHHDGWR